MCRICHHQSFYRNLSEFGFIPSNRKQRLKNLNLTFCCRGAEGFKQRRRDAGLARNGRFFSPTGLTGMPRIEAPPGFAEFEMDCLGLHYLQNLRNAKHFH